MGTQLYNKAQQQINPITEASVVTSKASGSLSDVETDLKTLYNKVSELQGDKELSSNIIVDIKYCLSNSKEESEIKQMTTWSDIFELPTYEKPYLWKKTIFTYKGADAEEILNTTYEIVATNLFEETETIYAASSTTSVPKIEYPVLTDGYGEPILDEDGNEQEDLTAFDDKIPKDWSEIPISISSATPNVYMSVRKRVNGLWERYSNPVQFGRWAFDSQLELRYQVTSNSNVPELERNVADPEGWVSAINTEFTGYLWMITATSVNGVLNATTVNNEQVIWNGPNLISIVK